MDFLSTGIQEFGRRLRRRKVGRSLAQARQRLARAEIDLGAQALPGLAGRTDLPAAFAPAHTRAAELAGEIARTQESIAALEAEISAIREREHATVREAHDRTTASQADQAALRQQQLELRAGSEPAPEALAVPGQTAFVSLHEAEKAAARAAAEAQEERRLAESAATRTTAEIQARLAPLRHDLARLRNAQAAPLRELGALVARHESFAPPEASTAVERRRETQRQVTSLEERRRALVKLSEGTDPQSVRLSIFVLVSFGTIFALALLLIFRAPPRRDWLPADSQVVAAVHLPRLSAAGSGHQDSPWNAIWRAATETLAPFPALAGPAPDVRRVVVALGEGKGDAAMVYRLVEMDGAAADVTGLLNEKHGFGQRYDSVSLGGLPIFERNVTTACAQIGPATLALGDAPSVSRMIRVRLGLLPDLKIDEQFLTKFQRLDRGSAIRIITRQPRELITQTGESIISPDLAEKCDLLGLAAYPGDPVILVLLFGTRSEAAATSLANFFREGPARHLRLQGAGAEATLLSVDQRESSLECRLSLSEAAAREFLPRLGGAKLQLRPTSP